MVVPGKRIYGFDIKLEVMNFPLRKLAPAEQNAFQRVVSLRRTEMAVASALARLDEPEGGGSQQNASSANEVCVCVCVCVGVRTHVGCQKTLLHPR